eukprot:m.205389 g.205389  ORF g.205389 m.205389 type:complete len:478 (+) comp39658_c0_seq57:87-1520(+)
MGDDVRDILDIEGPHSGTLGSVSKEAIIGSAKKPSKKSGSAFKRPEGMARELYALLYSDKNEIPPLIQTDTASGYKQNKAQLGRSKPRPWKWTPFKNPARQDPSVFYHWRRVADEGKPYPFANFNKKVDVPTYTHEEYLKHLQEEYPSTWTKDETDHLFDLCRRFDLKFPAIHDRYERKKFNPRTIESLKERYYSVCNKLAKIKSGRSGQPSIPVCHFDAQHETDRKAQLERLYNRTQEQVQEEESLLGELKKIDQRKREREKKQQDLQKIIAAAENSEKQLHKTPKKALQKKKVVPSHSLIGFVSTPEAPLLPVGEAGGGSAVKVIDKSGGVFVRSSRLKIPSSIGQKKLKVIETLLDDFGINMTPMPTEQICTEFNDIRNDIVLLLELKGAVDSCEYELQTLRHRFEALTSEPARERLPPSLRSSLEAFKPLTTNSALLIMDVVMSGPSAGGPQRKRRIATLEHSSSQYRKSRRF